MSDQSHQRQTSQGSVPDFDIPLPLRTRQDTVHLTPYSTPLPYDDPQPGERGRSPNRMHHKDDSRSPSMQSLLPADSNRDGRRKLLLIYVHGFVGSDTSFKKFPAHVHNLLTVMLAESHVVHSKIYPRYKTRKAIEFVRNDFSIWLSPHESEETDIVLVGHSLGGILAAEVALLGPGDPTSHDLFMHRILGIVNLDVPFLGLHRGVVSSGLGSLFRPKDKKKDPKSQAVPGDSFLAAFTPSPGDPNFDPAFPNDVRLRERSQLDGALNFIFKNSSNLVDATKKYITSHVEFGLCIADYPGLKRRYKRLRELEDVDECSQQQDGNGRILRRIRFVNYYTAATGRTKSPIREGKDSNASTQDLTETNPASQGRPSLGDPSYTRGVSISPRASREEKRPDSPFLSQTTDDDRKTPNLVVEPALGSPETDTTPQLGATLPDFPPPPYEPPEFDPSLYESRELLKEAQKDHSRQMKAYEKAVKEREKKLKAHNKLLSKQEKAAEKERIQQAKEAAKAASQQQKQPAESPEYPTLSSPSSPLSPLPTHTRGLSSLATEHSNDIDPEDPTKNDRSTATPKVKKDRKFCALPPREANGERDPLWVRVYMEGMDEVTAHQSLFISRNTAYDELVGDVAARIEGWVQDDLTRMMLVESEIK
ncbi:hypothetical protein FQN55_005330 [Onygenales sp. PD_40]|nr:hypothetical protein FQN55_005330 [Onygenales sp. PD_40]KAK2779809.1 hypothetical protein FQN53_001294 [Emmonsiellopsis sp. PD_33]KAK2802623.1 hypothetical protein FQN51_004416 [Onygenales sp. PD_10]